MPLSGPGLQGLLTPLMTASQIKGTSAPSMVMAISNAVSSWLTSLQIQTTDVGLMGPAGVGIGKAILQPASLIGPLQGMATANQLKGTSMPAFMTAIGNGVATFVSSMGMVQSNHTTVAVGSGIGQILVVGGPGALQGLLMGQFTANSIKGTSAASLATAIANGLATGIVSAIVTVVISGSPVTPPPVTTSGVGMGRLI